MVLILKKIHAFMIKTHAFHLEPHKSAIHCSDTAITFITKCHVEKKILKTNLISAKPLPRLALAPFHGEVMKQQV